MEYNGAVKSINPTRVSIQVEGKCAAGAIALNEANRKAFRNSTKSLNADR